MSQISQPILVATLCLSAAAASAQESKPSVKVYDVPKDGLKIEGKLTKDDPPLVNAPLAKLNGALHQVFHINLHNGQNHVIDLVSKDFDAFLILEDASGKRLGYDDDGGGGLNSRLAFKTTGGVCRLVVAAFDQRPGAFQIFIRIRDLAEDTRLAEEALKFNREGIRLHQQGKSAAAAEKMRQGLQIYRKLYPPSNYPDGHRHVATSLFNLGSVLQSMGQLEKALPLYQQSLEMRQKLYPKLKFPDGHPEIATGLNNMGFVLEAMGQAEKALSFYQQSLDMNRTLYPVSKFPDGHLNLAIGLNNLGSVCKAMGQAEKALPFYQQSLEMRQQLYPTLKFPEGHAELAIGLSNLGSALNAMGQTEKALPFHQQSLDMDRRLFPASRFPDGHPALVKSLNAMGIVLETMGQPEQALTYFQKCLDMTRQLYPVSDYPDGHPLLAGSLNNVGLLLKAMGSYEKALPHFEQALAINQNLFPPSKYADGHPELATSISNLGQLWKDMGSYKKALPYYEQALAMLERLYPESKYAIGHPELANSLANMSSLLHSMASKEKALRYCEQSLEMRQRLFPVSKYPDGHADLAGSLNNLGSLLHSMGLFERALDFHEQALAMGKRQYPESRYPDGHHQIAGSLINLGALLYAMDANEKALTYFEQAMAMYGKLGRRMAATASEAEAIAFANAQPLTRDVLLSLTRRLPTAAQSAYGAVWTSKSAITRVLEQRHAAARVAGAAHIAELDQLKALRRRIDQLLQDRRLSPAERDQLLSKATDDRDKLERALAKAMPTLARAKELDAFGPDALAKLLAEDAVLIDFVRYTHHGYDKDKPGRAGETRTPSYAAFVLARSPVAHAPGSPLDVKRIEIGDATTIDRPVADWRKAIEMRTDSPAAKQLHDLVWTKIAPHLPSGTKTLYLAPDGDLARVPWAALPVGKARVLLEDYVIATVPHGPFLLEQLQYPQKYAGSESALVLGDVNYGKGVWPSLPGTLAEMNAIAMLARGEGKTVSKSDATPNRLAELLPKARFAHLATHGEFQAKEFAAEQQRTQLAMQTRRFGDETQRVATKNPLGYVGLVLSGGEIMSGLSILDLNLENLKLVTLSACETGLGEYTGAKGVENLQQAFHIAGCPNVVASLWKVNDAATAAFMTKFYHEMWVNKKPPIEALREAQLTIYRHPELIPELSGVRGAPRQREAVAGKIAPNAPGQKTADTRLWAAFVLSGVGK